jgi:hypothetical protein
VLAVAKLLIFAPYHLPASAMSVSRSVTARTPLSDG